MTDQLSKLKEDEQFYHNRLRILKQLRNEIRLHDDFDDRKANVEVRCANSGIHHLVFVCAEREIRVSVAYFSSAKKFRGFRLFYPYPNFKNQVRRDFRIFEEGISKGYRPPRVAVSEAIDKVVEYLLSQNAFKEDDVLKVFYTDKFVE